MYTFLSSPFILLLFFLQALLHKAVVTANDEATTTAHFADSNRGRMSWVIEENALPWTGQYYYIESPQSAMSNLLVVVDSSNGNNLGNCASFAPRDNRWRRFFWTLSEDSLICNITDSESAISKVHFPPSNSPRTFSLRILAQQGPKCFRDMIIQNEKMEGCPPKLHRNSFQGLSLECGCLVPTQEFLDNSTAQQSFRSEVRTAVAPFHFINSRISSSDGNSVASHDLLPGLLNTINSSFLTTTATTTTTPTITIATAEIPNGTTITAANTEIPVQIDGIVSSLPVNPPLDVQHSIKSASSVLQAPAVSITTAAATEPSAVPELNAQPCADIHCQNNGTCVLGPDGATTCMCSEGFVGAQCEINLCANVQCMHDGLCRVMGNVSHCECQPGTAGAFCEQVICNPSCEQGGICGITNGVPLCHCPTGTVGINCNIIDTCNNNADACIEYGSDARCQLDPNSFALISPVAVNATFKCLCLNEHSEWIDCKQLPKKAQVSMTISAVASTTPSILFPAAATPSSVPETPEQIRSSQHIVRLFQNNPHFAHLFPNAFLIPNTTSTTTLIPSFIDANTNFDPHNTPVNETPTTAPRGPVELFAGLFPTTRASVPQLFGTTSRFPYLFSATISPFLITPRSFQIHHLFNITPELNDTLKLETTTPAAIASEHQKQMNFVNLTTLTIETTTRSIGKASEHMPEKLEEWNATEPALSPPTAVLEVSTEASMSETTTYDTSAIHLFTFPGPKSVTPHISVPVTIIGDEITASTPINHFTSNLPDNEDSTSVTAVSSITEGDLSSHLLLTTSSSTSESENEKNWSWSEHGGFTETTEEVKQTTTVDDFTTESVSTLGEDEVKFVKLTIGLPTTTVIPDLEHRSDGATGSGSDTSRSGTLSWTIVLAVTFALLVLAGVCAMLVLRYVRRSRKLHGKYNPAREESVLSSSYSMPMTTVTKEERLI